MRNQGQNLKMSHPFNLENLPFCRTKTAVQCIFAGQCTGECTVSKEKVTDDTVVNLLAEDLIFAEQNL